MNHNYYAQYDNVRIRPLKYEDIEALRIWRNKKDETRYLRDIGHISSAMQRKWFDEYQLDDTQIVFAIDEVNELNRIVGSMALYDIRDTQAEIGKIQIGDKEAHGRGIGRKSLVMGMKIGFECLNLNRIVGSVHRDNISARTNDLRIGFRIIGQHKSDRDGIEDELEIIRKDVLENNAYYDEIKIGKGEY